VSGLSYSALKERMALQALRWAPKGLYSEVVGWGARRTLPTALRASAYAAFARSVGADLSEVELPLDSYPSFGAFFSRALRPGAREIEEEPTAWVSPCDGRVLAKGDLDGGVLEAKGRGFHLDALVVDAHLAKSLAGGEFVTIYLSPRDYHRVHAPCAARLVAVHYVPGTLFPVNPLLVENVEQIFARNERLVLELETVRVGSATSDLRQFLWKPGTCEGSVSWFQSA
jgi:phosphatidylserine decarboxylase